MSEKVVAPYGKLSQICVNEIEPWSRAGEVNMIKIVELIQRFFSEPPQLIERLLLHGVTANFSISYFHHAKFQILLMLIYG